MVEFLDTHQLVIPRQSYLVIVESLLLRQRFFQNKLHG